MPKFKTFQERLRLGEIFDLNSAADIIGYSPRYLSGLCDAKKVPHTRRRGTGYFFTPTQIDELFETVVPGERA